MRGGLALNQCVILLDGSGAAPEVPAADRVRLMKKLLERLMGEALRRGFSNILLLGTDPAAAPLAAAAMERHPGVRVERLAIPGGPGGALALARDRLDEAFLLLDGRGWFDFNWLDLALTLRTHNADLAVALRPATACEPAPERLRRLAPLEPNGERTAGGVYALRRSVVEALPPAAAPDLDTLVAAAQDAVGIAYDGRYTPLASFVHAHAEPRPAVFFDRDGVLNVDIGYPHKPEQITWVAGAKAAVKRFNDLGYYTFVVTNQAGVARGFYPEADIAALHAWMGEELRAAGASIDDWRYCPFHPEGTVERFRAAHPWRKPEPGMLLDLLDTWPVDKASSLLIGDRASDLAAAAAAGVAGHLFPGGDLLDFVDQLAPAAAGGR